MYKLLAFILLVLSCSPLFAGEDFAIWENETFNAPFVDNIVATSDTITNNSGLNSLKVIVNYESMDPDGCCVSVGYQLQAVIEEQVAPGVWVPFSLQNDGVSASDSAAQRIITFSPKLILSPGEDQIIYAKGQEIARISDYNGVLADKFRLVLYLNENVEGELQSVTVTAYGRKYDQ